MTTSLFDIPSDGAFGWLPEIDTGVTIGVLRLKSGVHARGAVAA
jgi:hypothetical protein